MYYVFVDNSNVWIEGKYYAAVNKKMAGDIVEAHNNRICDNAWGIDFGKLLNCVVQGNLSEVKVAFILGSRPTYKDSLWNAMETAGFEVVTQQRNKSNKEKQIDTGIVQKINDYLYDCSNEGDVFVLVMGDSDYIPVVEAIEKKKRIARIAFWDNASGELIAAATEYLSLNFHFDELTF